VNTTTDSWATTVAAPTFTSSPSCSVSGNVTGDMAGAAIGALARITYYVGVQGNADDMPFRFVPLIVEAKGSAFADWGRYTPFGVDENVIAGVYLGSPPIRWQDAWVAVTGADWLEPTTRTFDKTTTITVGSGGSYKVTIQASISVNGTGVGRTGQYFGDWSISAWVDPIVTIDPSFPYADEYHVTISSNVVAPEPAALLFLAVGGLAVLRRRRAA
jgi:MYXO-CTERM domain-containing protein